MRIEAEYLEDEELYERVVESGLVSARESLDLATANLKTMLAEMPPGSEKFVSLPALLLRKVGEGVRVRLLHSGVPSENFLAELRGTGLWKHPGFSMRRCPRVHLKLAVVDGRAAYLGTANLTGAGLGAKSEQRRNFEAGIWSESPELVERLGRFFLSIWDGALCEGCGRAKHCPQPLEEPEFG
jgi:phosphatidylserine/phosphatidylglycerophosphate/cardiolipin synthase-like enzyme